MFIFCYTKSLLSEVISIEDMSKFHGQEMLNFKSYFDEDFAYVEEFDTPDGEHWMAREYPQNWTEEIFEMAKKCGYVDKCIELLGE